MRVYAAFIYVFLYAPIALIVVFSFNAGHYAMDWQGFSVEWYGKAFANPILTKALVTSLIVASSTAVIATVVGTLCALGLERMKGWLRQLFDALIYIAIMVPGVVIGISTLIAFVTVFDALNPALEAIGIARLQMGLWTVIAAHVLFNLAVVVLIIRARLAGLLLSFTFSFEDFIITFFVAGPNTTLPIYMYSSIRRGVTPEINAIGSTVLVSSLTLLMLAQFLLRARTRTR
jgi:spermidine/putrescine transport system permease protein